jgi:hypothetical protein
VATGAAAPTGATAALTGLAAGTYYLHVSGAGTATNQYSLALEPGASSATRVLYVNDSANSGDYYTVAVGSDTNDGLSPETPKATVKTCWQTFFWGRTTWL